MKIRDVLGLRYEPDRYSSLSNARSAVSHALKPQRIMLGDDGTFWVVCTADAAKLEKVGYEYA